MVTVHEDPIGTLLECVPAFKSQDISTSSNLYAFLDRRIQKLALKINTIAPYSPVERQDVFGLNSNFPLAVCKWLSQFPEDQRLGFLLPVLGAQYLTQPEMDLFLSIAMTRLEEQVAENKACLKMPIRQPTHEKIRIYPVSQFGEYDDFIHKIGLSGTRDRDKQPSRTTIEDLVYESFSTLRSLAEYGKDFTYYDEAASQVEQLLKSFLDAHIVLVEDSSFSGTRIGSTVSKFLRLLNILFGKYGRRLEGKGYSTPYVYLLVLVGTTEAQEVALKIKGNEELMPLSKNFSPIFGFLFDEADASRQILPENLGELRNLLGAYDLRDELTRSVEFFKNHYFHHYLTETAISEATGKGLEAIKWGFDGKGWLIVTHTNCPNNALPILWYPHINSRLTSITALFPRIESHTDHSNKAGSFRNNLNVVAKDQRGYLKTFISRYYDSLP